ncbi:Shedu anti-phage system protein SduA domain-containing protein [Micromonospora andamanensis]|uniref:Shedu anti-phage system protein SduA domain-containing protein n=1 Tax=Micromonospora andamanensis TaxID=1287068 RepID=UPI003642C19D
MSQWYDLLGTDPEESAVQEFLELHPAMVPGGSGDVGPGGHHGSEMSAVFRRPMLVGNGPSFEPDFMWVTRSSALITPILVEIERPGKRWFQQNGRPTAQFRDAHDQLNDWRSWFARDGNRAIFRENFLFEDSFSDRPIEPQFVLVYGRALEFEAGGGHTNPRAIRHKRESQRAESETFLTFDSLRPRYDHGRSITLTMTTNGPRLFCFSPCYGTRTDTGPTSVLLGDPTEALARSVMMSSARKDYIAHRWAYWRDVELSSRAGTTRVRWRRTGIE